MVLLDSNERMGRRVFDPSTTPALRATPPVPGGEFFVHLLQNRERVWYSPVFWLHCSVRGYRSIRFQFRPLAANSIGCSMLNVRVNSRFSPGFMLTRHTSFPFSFLCDFFWTGGVTAGISG